MGDRQMQLGIHRGHADKQRLIQADRAFVLADAHRGGGVERAQGAVVGVDLEQLLELLAGLLVACAARPARAA